MVSFFEIVRRALQGPYYPEKHFDLKIFVPALRKIQKKYDIPDAPTGPIANDDELADRVWQAGLELCAETGVYCTDSNRLIQFSEEEIHEALRDAPNAPAFGEGSDRRVMRARKPDSDLPLWCFLGAGGATCSNEDVFIRLVEGYGRNPYINSVTCPNLATINGMRTQAGTPLEILGCIRSVEMARIALRRAQRPGLPIMNSISTAVTATGKITGSEFGLRDTDCWSIGFTAEFKISFERMNEIAYVLARNGGIQGENGAIMGGWAGGPGGVAITTAAYHVFSILVLRASNQLTFPLHLRGWNTNTPLLWCSSLAAQAVSRNSHMPFLAYTYTAGGPMTKMNFYEIAAGMITIVVSGGNIEFGGVGEAKNIDYLTPMQPLLASEVAHAAVGMTRAQARPIVEQLVARYEHRLEDPPKGVPFQEAYDWGTIEPKSEYVDLYAEMKQELTDLGLRFR